MNFKETKEYLNRAFVLYCEIKSKAEQVEHLRSLLDSIGPIIANMPKGQPDPHSNERKIVNILDKESKIAETANRLLEVSCEIAEIISKIKSQKQRRLLELRYLKFLQWDDIVEELDISSFYVYQLHRDAVLSFSREYKNLKNS